MNIQAELRVDFGCVDRMNSLSECDVDLENVDRTGIQREVLVGGPVNFHRLGSWRVPVLESDYW
eukprot:CAMPEP_0184449602 /NCGR_PEP_ID=MMETSP0740-20130409/5195_1 /TAXON_ID=385413 /ORGANISM="Thalassiosira miniscula, Strain CCMP1093" /LENGTH=63 /DNA_ID=CAMNT_0026819733 /DNA_START=452 /DNA_END=640 /DNA_ORIENTATION=+